MKFTFRMIKRRKGEKEMTIEEILAVLMENGEQVTVEDYDDFFIIETTKGEN